MGTYALFVFVFTYSYHSVISDLVESAVSWIPAQEALARHNKLGCTTHASHDRPRRGAASKMLMRHRPWTMRRAPLPTFLGHIPLQPLDFDPDLKRGVPPQQALHG